MISGSDERVDSDPAIAPPDNAGGSGERVDADAADALPVPRNPDPTEVYNDGRGDSPGQPLADPNANPIAEVEVNNDGRADRPGQPLPDPNAGVPADVNQNGRADVDLCVVIDVAVEDADEPRIEQRNSCGTTDTGGPADVDRPDAVPVWQNPENPLDVNNDSHMSPLDALVVINELNRRAILDNNGRLPETMPENVSLFIDVNGDGFGTPLDVLVVVNELNGRLVAEGELGPATDSASSGSIAWHVLQAVDQGVDRAQRYLQTAFAISPDANADSSSNHSATESNVRGAMPTVRSLNSRFVAQYGDQTKDDSLESVLEEIAGDISEHWNEVR